MKIGANYSRNQTEFVAWAPYQNQLSLVLPMESQILEMNRLKNGYWGLNVNGIKPNTSYMFQLQNNANRPDPASYFQPQGVFGSSAVVDHISFSWNENNWSGISLKEMIMYELHIGAFSPEGTFAGTAKRAQELSKIGINAVEIMPVSQFTGARNWGYDAVFPFAVQNTYGGPDELKKMIQEFHSNKIAVILDVVYNHLGPEGNFLNDFGPYFLFSRKTPWGASINFDGSDNRQVRNFFLENAIHWFKNYHFDGLRLDAVFTIIDNSPRHFLKELSETVADFSKTNSRKLLLIAENDRVEPKIVQPRKKGGFGLDALWHDNLHHSVHAILTGERNWYYSSFGTLEKIVEALNEECISQTKNSDKSSSNCIATDRLVVFSQNHDQIGNRPLGERLITIAGLEAAKLAAGFIILSPFTPLLFMGEEYGEKAPFLFFTDYSDEILRKNVTVGRKKELKQNGWKNQPPNPQKISTFSMSKIDWQQNSLEEGKRILAYYEKLISLRRSFLDSNFDKRLRTKIFMSKSKSLLVIKKNFLASHMVTIANFSKIEQNYRFPCSGGTYMKALDSATTEWLGPGSALPERANQGDKHIICPLSIAFYLKSKEKNYA